jgi:hypothetical protein
MPSITALTASDIMTWSVMIEMSPKAGFFSLIRSRAAIAKNAKTQVASFARFGSLTPPAAVTAC